MGLFDPPMLRAQKQAAKAARRLRMVVAREATIELNMLARRFNSARDVRDEAYAEGDAIAGHAITIAMQDGKAILDKAELFTLGFEGDLAALRSPSIAAHYEAIASLELDGRTCLTTLRDEAREHLRIFAALTADRVLAKARAAEPRHSPA